MIKVIFHTIRNCSWSWIEISSVQINSFLASGGFCRLLITFANSLDQDQDQQILVLIWIQSVDTLIVFLKEAFAKVNFERKYQQTATLVGKLPCTQE